MERRRFLGSCAAVAGGAIPEFGSPTPGAHPRRYPAARLVDIHGVPLKASSLKVETTYLFHFPYAATPCFLLDLARAPAPQTSLARADGAAYRAPQGVGPRRSIVAYSAICAHKLAYPTREVSFIGYQREPSSTSNAKVIHCCADHSVYDPAAGARVLAGPAPQPLAAIVLDYDARTGGLAATGTLGAEQFAAFFEKYAFKLSLDYGGDRARRPVGGETVTEELDSFCRNPIRC